MTAPTSFVNATTPPIATPWAADPQWDTIDFISDLHLHETSPQTFAVWAHYLEHSPAQAIVILGDLFEAWVGDDATHEPGLAQQASEMLRACTQKKWVGIMHGNRDFLLGSLPDERHVKFASNFFSQTGTHLLNDPTRLSAFGQTYLLSHGDALCIADTAYQQFRQQVRSSDWQRHFLSQPLPQRQAQARHMREQSQSHQQGMAAQLWADVDASTAIDWLTRNNTHTLIHGHTHRPGHYPLSSFAIASIEAPFHRWVLSDWDYETPAARGGVLRLTQSGLICVDPRI